VQPLATTSSYQQNLVALAPIVANAVVDQPRATEICGFFIDEHSRHAPETFALLCIRLI
jgi:hypothetical protein